MINELKISVIVPCYNQARFLDQCISSLMNQTHVNWECILINDGSTDDTETKCLDWQYKDTRIKYIKKLNGGLSSARNSGLAQATGDYVQFLDCDDFLRPDKFAVSLDHLQQALNKIVISNFQLFDEQSQKVLSSHFQLKEEYFNYDSLLLDWDKKFTIPIHCALFPRVLIGKYQFNEMLKAKEDWLFWLQVFENKPQTIFIDEAMAFYRISSLGMTRNDAFMHENQMRAFQMVEQTIKDKAAIIEFLKYNNTYYMNENFELKEELKRIIAKRKLKYKLNKVLSFFKFK